VKRLIGTIGDRLQALFPPNRIMLVVAPTTTAASLWLSAWLTAHVPGVELPAGVIAGAMGVVGLIAVTLFYKWFDQWQKGESPTVDEDLEWAIDRLDDATVAYFSAHNTVRGVGVELEDLSKRILKRSINEAEVAATVGSLLGVIGRFVDEAPVPAKVVSPAAEAVPPAAPAQAAE
jgi:hypothetical protein